MWLYDHKFVSSEVKIGNSLSVGVFIVTVDAREGWCRFNLCLILV